MFGTKCTTPDVPIIFENWKMIGIRNDIWTHLKKMIGIENDIRTN